MEYSQNPVLGSGDQPETSTLDGTDKLRSPSLSRGTTLAQHRPRERRSHDPSLPATPPDPGRAGTSGRRQPPPRQPPPHPAQPAHGWPGSGRSTAGCLRQPALGSIAHPPSCCSAAGGRPRQLDPFSHRRRGRRWLPGPHPAGHRPPHRSSAQSRGRPAQRPQTAPACWHRRPHRQPAPAPGSSRPPQPAPRPRPGPAAGTSRDPLPTLRQASRRPAGPRRCQP
jgi:hypothetical protein